MIKVGISGKIASGKSEAEKIIQSLGYKVFDLDIISREIFEKEKIKKNIFSKFQTLNRSEIGKIIFKNTSKKEILEKIIHPELKKEIFKIFDKYKNEQMIFISGALLFKSGFYKLFDKTIFVSAKDEIRLARLMKRNNLTKENALQRLNSQDDGSLADFIIDNNQDINSLEEKIKNIIKGLI